MKAIKCAIFCLFLLFCHSSYGQYYSTGSDPSNIKWKQIKSPFFKVVYPDDFESEAKRFISMLDSLYLYGGYTLKHSPKPIPVLIHSKSAYSNGLVSWAPKRMEIYPTPGQSVFAQDYLEQLAIHEFRHVVQIDKLNAGFTKVLSYPFGQQAVGAILGLYVPLWFLEGDATLSETTLSKSGRGRLPSFEQEIRAQILEKKTYSYEKAYFGSYKDYIPNHYRMGYLFTAGARYKYGPEVWENALEESGRKSWSITPFNRGIKKVTGKNKVALYHEVFNDWENRWYRQNDELELSPLTVLSERDESYKDYTFPVAIDEHNIIAEVSGPGEVRHFVRINTKTKQQHKILTLGRRDREPFSYANNIICWTELEQHARWENQHFSVIRTYNIVNGQEKKITTKSRYFAPSISPDGKTIAAVHISTSNEKSIHLLDAISGEIIRSLSSPDNNLPLIPSWHPHENKLILVLLSQEGKAITELNLDSEEWKQLLAPSFTEIVAPKYINGHIYFSGAWSGIDNIYRIDSHGDHLQKVTESRFGATQLNQGANNKIVYQDYTSDGYQIVSSSLDSLTVEDFVPRQNQMDKYVLELQKDEKAIPNLKNLPTDEYQPKKYSKWNLFNFHSWAPAFINMDDATLNTGISLLSQNLLNSTFTTIGYNADSQYSREKYYFNISHRAWWPVIEFEFKAGDEKYKDDSYYRNETDTFRINIDSKEQHIYAHLEVNLPLNLTRGKWQRRIQPSFSTSYQYASGYSYTQTYVTPGDNGWIEKETIEKHIPSTHAQPLNYGLMLYNIQNRSARDLSSKWGQVVELSYRHTPVGGTNIGDILGLHTRLYFPGIGKHHSIRIDNDWQKKNPGEKYDHNDTRNYYYYFADFVRFPRGVTKASNDELYSFKGDYLLPLINPDLNVPGVIYLKRITANLFYDYSTSSLAIQDYNTNEWSRQSETFQSLGTELRAEFHALRFVFPFSIGYRYAYLPDTKNHFNEVLFSLGFNGFSLGN